MSFPRPLFSLTRFHKENPKLPCWTAGRFFKKDSKSYFLKSQGKTLFCESKSALKNHPNGSWAAVQLLSQIPAPLISLKAKGIQKTDRLRAYQTEGFHLLQSPITSYKEKAFSYQNKGAVLQNWRRFLRSVEDFFISKGLASASTPFLVKCPGTEPHLKALKSSFKNYYLPTSPEIQLKKLLCQDWTDFFEIKTCFREENPNQTHQVEFHLLEWYRAFYSLEDLMRETAELIVFLQKSQLRLFKSFKTSKTQKTKELDDQINSSDSYKIPPAKFSSMAELFKKHLQFSLSPNSSKRELFKLAQKEALPVQEGFSYEDLFFSLFLNKIEPQICQSAPVFIYNYPPQLRAFAQINPEGWASRFELYWRGMELANAFYEVSQFEEQKQIFQAHLTQRKDKTPLDEELLSNMKRGMPPCSGAALGLDRLFLVLTGKKSLKLTRLFPL